MFEFNILAASSSPCPMYASDATFNLEVVKNSLMQLSACTCGSRLSSMFVLRASLDASMTRSLMAREKSLFESAAVMLAMSAGMPADLRVIAPALSCIDKIVSFMRQCGLSITFLRNIPHTTYLAGHGALGCSKMHSDDRKRKRSAIL
jgi:hypothetical protein